MVNRTPLPYVFYINFIIIPLLLFSYLTSLDVFFLNKNKKQKTKRERKNWCLCNNTNNRFFYSIIQVDDINNS